MPEILYHYCSTATFYSIISNRSIRLSSMSLSNDALEGKMVLKTFEKLHADRSIIGPLDDIIPKMLEMVNDRYDGLAFCLSEAGDLLSQWRGYADDGQGFCIGFSSEYLKKLDIPSDWKDYFQIPVELKRVVYEETEHKEAVRETYEIFQAAIARMRESVGVTGDEERKKAAHAINHITQGMLTTAYKLSSSLFILKSDAFKEEREWRLIATVDSETHRTGDFRPTSCNLIPYQTFEMTDKQSPAILDIIIGPKNKTPISIVKSLISKYGFESAAIKQSRASYR